MEDQERPNLKLLEEFYQKTVEACMISTRYLLRLNEMEEEVYGFNHNDRDLDGIIDSVDYGGGGLSFKRYHKMMMEEMEVSRNVRR